MGRKLVDRIIRLNLKFFKYGLNVTLVSFENPIVLGNVWPSKKMI